MQNRRYFFLFLINVQKLMTNAQKLMTNSEKSLTNEKQERKKGEYPNARNWRTNVILYYLCRKFICSLYGLYRNHLYVRSKRQYHRGF